MLEDGGAKLGAKDRDVPKEGSRSRIVTSPQEENVLFLGVLLDFSVFLEDALDAFLITVARIYPIGAAYVSSHRKSPIAFLPLRTNLSLDIRYDDSHLKHRSG